MSATWTLLNAGEFQGRGYWTCQGCGATLTAQRLPAVLRHAAQEGRCTGPIRALCAHCAERPPAEGEVDVVLHGRVIHWTP